MNTDEKKYSVEEPQRHQDRDICSHWVVDTSNDREVVCLCFSEQFAHRVAKALNEMECFEP